uniref:Uncharacterized protein n=1 Tax=Bionectria ochroleuca TaxID=29856 RepID=A0A0B7K9Y6_BIOOC
MAPRTDFPRIRACLFDMDGLLLDTEDIYTKCTNIILERYGKSNLPWPIKARLQGRPGPAATKIFFDWADLPIDQDEYTRQNTILQAQDLGRTRYYNLKEGEDPTKRVHIALATSSHEANFRAGRRAGMRVIWCPHPELKKVYAGREGEILAGRMGEAGEIDMHQVGELDDGWAEYLPALEDFPYAKFGIEVPPASVEEEDVMKNDNGLTAV